MRLISSSEIRRSLGGGTGRRETFFMGSESIQPQITRAVFRTERIRVSSRFTVPAETSCSRASRHLVRWSGERAAQRISATESACSFLSRTCSHRLPRLVGETSRAYRSKADSTVAVVCFRCLPVSICLSTAIAHSLASALVRHVLDFDTPLRRTWTRQRPPRLTNVATGAILVQCGHIMMRQQMTREGIRSGLHAAILLHFYRTITHGDKGRFLVQTLLLGTKQSSNHAACSQSWCNFGAVASIFEPRGPEVQVLSPRPHMTIPKHQSNSKRSHGLTRFPACPTLRPIVVIVPDWGFEFARGSHVASRRLGRRKSRTTPPHAATHHRPASRRQAREVPAPGPPARAVRRDRTGDRCRGSTGSP